MFCEGNVVKEDEIYNVSFNHKSKRWIFLANKVRDGFLGNIVSKLNYPNVCNSFVQTRDISSNQTLVPVFTMFTLLGIEIRRFNLGVLFFPTCLFSLARTFCSSLSEVSTLG